MYFWSKTDLSNYFTWVYISGIGPTEAEKKKHPGTDPDPTTPYTKWDEEGIKTNKQKKQNKTLDSSLQNRMLSCWLHVGRWSLYSSISIHTCQPVLTLPVLSCCTMEPIPRSTLGNVSNGVLLSQRDLSSLRIVFRRCKALAGKAWDENCEFRRLSSARSRDKKGKAKPHIPCQIIPKELWLVTWHFLIHMKIVPLESIILPSYL